MRDQRCLLIACLLAAIAVCLNQPAAAQPPNVLLIAIDDLRPELGCYGASHMISPNIDRLASQGMLFRHAYCQQALCNPSRSSLMTGQRPDSIGITSNHAHFRAQNPGVVTLPQHFRNHGYHTQAIGKVFHGVFPEGSSKTTWDTMGDPPSWSVPAIRFGPRYYFTEQGIDAARQVYREVYQAENPGPDDWTKKLVFGPATESPDIDDGLTYDGKVAEAAVTTLQQLAAREQPFFLAVGFFRPHSPYVAPKKYFDLYDDEAAFLDPAHTTIPHGAPDWSGHNSGELRRYTDQPNGRAPIPESGQRRIRHAYFACVSFVDAQVGRVLDELDRQDLADNTIVVLLGDHGYHLGEKSLWGKTTNFELDTRVPLIVRTPDVQHAGQQSNSLVELLDIYPTLVDLAGLPENARTEGISLRPVLENPTSSTKPFAFSQHPRSGGLMGYSVRSPTHRLTRWIHRETSEVRGTELYRYAGELNESTNIADDPDQQPVIEQLDRGLVQELGLIPSSSMDSPKTPERNRDGELSFARVFGDGMVLQCEAPIRVWGAAPANASVELTLGDQRRDVNSDSAGHWMVEFPPQAASTLSRDLSASCRDHIVTIRDVLLGEVWLCAGQSNMDFEWRKSSRAGETAASADDAELRLLDFVGAVTGTAGEYDQQQMEQLDPRRFSDGVWRVSDRESASNFSAVGFYFATHLRHKLDRPVGMIDVSVGGTPIEAWINPDQLGEHPLLASMVQGNWLDNGELGTWCRSRARDNLRQGLRGGLEIPGDELGPNHSFKPGFMYRSAIEPFSPMAIRGVLWYQGESNAGSAARCRQYGPAFELLVNSWRSEFGNDRLPFGYVQLPPMNRPAWPIFREVQRRSLSANTNLGMAITMDAGDPNDVHPNRKYPVGERLAWWALTTVYDRDELPAMGPLFRDVTPLQNRIVVRFETGGSELQTTDDTAPRHFEIAGADLLFHPAEAVINGDEITLTSELVPRPLHVRYAWLSVPRPPVNLTNSNGMPASPFTTIGEFWRE